MKINTAVIHLATQEQMIPQLFELLIEVQAAGIPDIGMD